MDITVEEFRQMLVDSGLVPEGEFKAACPVLFRIR